MNIDQRFAAIIKYFSENMPSAQTELHYSNPFELLVAVILSAQCTDKRVNMVTPSLFERFPNARAMACSSPEEIFSYIHSISYPNNKAKHLYNMANQLLEHFAGNIPSDLNDLMTLSGVGRKTANVIASVVYNKPTLAVDTHVFRVAARIGLSVNAKTPLQTEQQLLPHIPKELVPIAHHWLILHGRYICIARKPKCSNCGISQFCKFFEGN